MSLKTLVLLMTLAVGSALVAHSAAADETAHRDDEAPTRLTVVDTLDVASVWSGHPVGFALLTHGDRQFVAFYDAERRLTLAQRRLDERQWEFARLPVATGWDSHNYLTMAVDDAEYLHLSGDMHVDPLKYYRTTRPLDATTFLPEAMIGREEDRTTYPRFLRGPQGELIFMYRDGGSGNGSQIFNKYDHSTQTWERLLEAPLIDGEGRRSAYLDGPVKGPDGFYHLAWVWRHTPDAETNHDPSYARSRDLRHWETSGGEPLPLPIRWSDAEVIDPVPSGGGIINGNVKVGFDDEGRVTVTFHKYDADGHTQPFNARLEDGCWKLHQITDWPYRWEFGGRGSLGFSIRLGPVKAGSDGRLTQTFRHPEFGSGTWLIDPETLQAVGTVHRRGLPAKFGRPEGDFPGLTVRWSSDAGRSPNQQVRYRLRWETLSANRDRPRDGALPPPSMLRVYALEAQPE